MKILAVILTIISLNSCNTCIGLYRDTKQGVNWTRDKMQGADGGSEGGSSNAPVY